MGRPTRSFKLKLSPRGMDLLIASHCHLILSTRRLIAWGTTLHVAVAHLETLPTATIVSLLPSVMAAGLSGEEEHHVGAPHGLSVLAAAIAERVRSARPERGGPSLTSIYLLALDQLTRADAATLRISYERAKCS